MIDTLPLWTSKVVKCNLNLDEDVEETEMTLVYERRSLRLRENCGTQKKEGSPKFQLTHTRTQMHVCPHINTQTHKSTHV